MIDRGPWLARVVARLLLPAEESTRLIDGLEEAYESRLRGAHPRVGDRLWYVSQVLRSVPPLLRAAGGRGGSLRLDALATLRRLRKAPTSAIAASATLALTLGAAMSILGVVQEVVLEPLPFERSDELVALELAPVDRPDAARRAVSGRTLDQWRVAAGELASVEGYDPTNLTLSGVGRARRIDGVSATVRFLELLGVQPARGRLPTEDDAGHAVIVVSHDFWVDALAGQSSVVGSAVVLDGRPHTVIGVLPSGFEFPLNHTDVWRPVSSAGVEGEGPFRVIARVPDRQHLPRLIDALTDASPLDLGAMSVRATAVHAAVIGDGARTLGFLAGAIAIGFMIAFANLSVLMMVRSMDRERELAVRRALGAPRSDGRRQMVIEAVALVGTGLTAGCVLAWWASPFIGRYALEFSGVASRDLSLSWSAFVAVALAALFAAAIAATTATRAVRRSEPRRLLRGGGTVGGSHVRFRRGVIAGEVAIAFMLVLLGGAITGSLVQIQSMDPGFEPSGAVKAQLTLPRDRYPNGESVAEFYRQLVVQLQARPGLDGSVVDEVPLTGDGGRRYVGVDAESLDREVVVRSTAPGYFRVMGVEVLSGRGFEWSDDSSNQPRFVVSASLARSAFGAADPVGRSLWLQGMASAGEIVGVVEDVSHASLDESGWSTLYQSALQAPSRSSVVVLRDASASADPGVAVREVVGEIDSTLPVYGIRSLDEVVAASPGVPTRRLLTFTLVSFALLALILSAIGMFGVAAHDATRRRPELALRAALGATPIQVLRAALQPEVATFLIGMAVGGTTTLIALPLLQVWVPLGNVDARLVGWSAFTILVVSAVAVLPVGTRVAFGREDGVGRAP